MSTTYPFDRDEDWNTWGTSFGANIAANAAAYGIIPATATAVVDAASDFSGKLQIARAPDTRSKPNTQAKRDALNALRRVVRPIVAHLRTSEAIGDSTRAELGLKIVDRSKTAVTLPAVPPIVDLAPTGLVSAHAVVRNPADPNRRGKPRGVKSILVRAMQTDGPMPAEDVSLWPVKAVESGARIDLVWPELRQPATVWVACSWLTTRNQEGRPSVPVNTRLAGTGQAAQPVTAAGDGPMKIAA